MGQTPDPQSRLESPLARNLGRSQSLALVSISTGISRGSQLGSQGAWWQLHSGCLFLWRMGPLLK